jgi:hypothetical protein
VLIPGFRSSGKVRAFAEGWGEKAARFVPQAIAGKLSQVEALPMGVSVSHAIIVIGKWEDARVTEGDRERLWSRFRVPVFEQIVDEKGSLLAAECEGHCGLHLVEALPAAARPATGVIDESVCGCGKTTARWVPAEEAELGAGASAGGL